ncbi:TonB-dependent receptor [Pseudomaricurvus alkylphenolicus]|uniref:TonB-dependent receptor n=1 Tax=Pseudomaricurvus alkylphenolicus TaxID=1306991 RepID=UPI00142469C5|nr:TonB-dependent receptor [Pseudomaricurvus alkylphenolicus]NIB38367.1 TonB-dependent receptor [Pseudomaricurvus alkylphenolicus]
MHRFKPRTGTSVAAGYLVSMSLISPTLWATETATSDDELAFQIEEIVVTANRRSESLQEAAVTVSAFSSASLDKAQIERITDLQFSSPGLNIDSFSGDTQITMRGVGTNAFGIGVDNSVAVYVDGVYMSRQSVANQEFIDVERIEVLKGPQATLYGRNATGGAINIVSKAPSEQLEMEMDVRVGNYQSRRYRAAISGALGSKTVLGRISVIKSENDGYSENLLPGSEDFDRIDNNGVRAALLITPTEDLDITLRADYSEQDGSGVAYQRVESTALAFSFPFGPFGPNGTYDSSPRRAYHNLEDNRPARQYGYNAKVEYNFDSATVTSISAYNRGETGPTFEDLDDSEIDLLHNNGTTSTSSTYSQEIVLTSAPGDGSDGNFDWLLGALYMKDDARQNDSYFVYGPLPTESKTLDNTAYALFGEASYYLSEKLVATLGLRYSHESKEMLDVNSGIDYQDDWSDVSPKLGLKYIVSDDIMIYANLAKGFKSGGYNIQDASNSFDPEELWSLESGIKSTLYDGRVRLNASAFLYDYSDMQVNQSYLHPFFGPTLFIDNAGEAEVFGAELEVLGQITDRLSLGLNLAYLNAKFSDGIEISDPDTTLPVDVSGNALPKSPDWSASLSAQYAIPVFNLGELSLGLEYYYQGENYHSPFEEDLIRSDSYDNINANATFTSNDEHWHVSVFGRNITDEEIVSGVTADSFGLIHTYAAPRTYGIEVGYKY